MTILETPDQIRAAQLLSARGAIKLEKLGMRHSRLGQNGLKRLWAKHYGLSPRAKHDEVLAKINEELNSLKEKIHGCKQQPLPL
jgi:hypothetical protein